MSQFALSPPRAAALGSSRAAARAPARRAPVLTVGLNLVSLAGCLLVWALVTHFKLDLGVVSFRNVPSPAEVLAGGWKFLTSQAAPHHLLASLRRVALGFVLAAAAGIGVGLLAGRIRLCKDLALPPLEVLRPIPAVAWIPLAILMFPSSELSMIFITFTGALFPILLNTIHGVEAVDPRLLASARSLGANRLALLREVVLPGALPSIVTGLAIGMGTSWFCLVTAEMISGQWGIGYYTWESYTLQNYPDIVVGMLLIGVLGMASSLLVRQLGALATPWQRQAGGKP
jgi:NitT/TauT family transport system permease protein